MSTKTEIPATSNAPRENTARSVAETGRPSDLLQLGPAAVAALMLLLATLWDGAFDLRHWGLLGILALVMLGVLLAAGALARPRGPVAVALAAIWGLAAWALLSAIWADSPATAWEGANRAMLYAALVTIALLALGDRRQARWIGAALIAGVSVIAVMTLVEIHVDGPDQFLAGRLDMPVGYRNASAGLFAFAFWPLVGIAAARGGNRTLRGSATAAAMLSLGLAFLTQSRGPIIALVAGAAVALAIGPDRVRRSWLALALFAGVAIASEPLLAPYDAFDGGAGSVGDSEIAEAANALTALVLVAFGAGFLLALLDSGLRSTAQSRARARRTATVGLAVLGAVGVIGAVAAIGNPVSYTDEKLDEFTRLDPDTQAEATRLGSVGGQRYDLWRVAWEQFKEDPLTGAGEGNYAVSYYQERRTDRNISNAHSVLFERLSGTGIVGTLLFLAFLAALGTAIARGTRHASRSDRLWIGGLAAAGAAVVAQAMVDWFWLIPGVMGLGLFALGLAACMGSLPAPPGSAAVIGRSRARWLGAGAALLATLSVTTVFLSDLYVRKARAEPAASSDAQLSEARTAEKLNPWSVTPLYLQASALETQDDRDAAREALEEALDLEPRNFVTLALLGDLELRDGDEVEARELYRRALALNPRDVGLQELAGLR
jgi:tetratricopeptide (TPR) repeat protein